MKKTTKCALVMLGITATVVACGDEDMVTPVLSRTPLASIVEPDTGTYMQDLQCGSISYPCTLPGISSGAPSINTGTASAPTWTPCTSMPGGCLNIPGTPVYGSDPWGAATAVKSAQSMYSPHAPHNGQELDIEIALREIVCQELNSLLQGMIGGGDVWIGTTMPPAVGGEFADTVGNLNYPNPPEHQGTIYINQDTYWEFDGYMYYLKKDLRQLALALAHEAAHAWFGHDNTISPGQHTAIYNHAESCVRQ